MVSSTFALWTCDGICSVDLTGPTPLPRHSLTSAGPLAVHGGEYFVAAGDTLYRGSAPAGVPAILEAGSGVKALAVDETGIYWGDCSSNIWIKRRSAAGAVSRVVSIYECPSALLLDGDRIWYGSLDDGGLRMISEKLIANQPVTAAALRASSLRDAINSLAMDANYVYFASPSLNEPGVVMRVSRTGTTPPELVVPADTEWFPRSVQVDRGEVIWATLGDLSLPQPRGAIRRTTIDRLGHPPETLVDGVDQPMAVAVAGDWVYFVTSSKAGTAALYRVAR